MLLSCFDPRRSGALNVLDLSVRIRKRYSERENCPVMRYAFSPSPRVVSSCESIRYVLSLSVHGP